jgi:RNA polymerase sigma-70 factor (ECF subfamily)
MHDDASDFRALRRGDEAALGRVYERHRAPLYAFALGMLGRAGAAEDAVQETFLRLVDQHMRLRPDTVLPAWLFTVCRNLIRSQQRHSAVSLRALQQLAQSVGTGSMPSPADQWERSLRERHLSRALLRLRPADREILLIELNDHLAPAQRRSILGLEPAAYRKRLSRARQRLKDRLFTEAQPREMNACPT